MAAKAEVSADGSSTWYLLPFDTYTDGTTGVDGTWSESSGTYNASKSFSTKVQWPQWTCSDNIGGVFPYLQSGKTYFVYYTFTAYATSTGGFGPIQQLVFRPDYDDVTNSVYGTKVSSNVTVAENKETATWTGIFSFTPSTDLVLSTASAIFAKMSAKDLTVKGRVSWAFYLIAAEEDELASVVEAINNQTHVLQGSIDTQTQQQADQWEETYNPDSSQSETEFSETVDGVLDELSGSMGLFDYVDTVITDFMGMFKASSVGEPVLTWPAYSITVEGEEHSVWQSQQVNLEELLADFGPLMTAVRFALMVLVWGAVIHYIWQAFEEIFGNGGAE